MPVADDGGSYRRPLSSILLVNVLYHFLAPLVLKIHVDIRRLSTLARNEALK